MKTSLPTLTVPMLALSALLATSAARAGDTFMQTYELPNVEHTTATFSGGVGVETFDSRAIGSAGFVSTFGGSPFTGTYSAGADVQPAIQYGGAGGSGRYVQTFANTGFSITLNTSVNYFGYWLSALDEGNVVEFYSGAALVGSLGPSAVLSAIGSNPAYFGNPDAPFLGQDASEVFAFVNFYDTTGSFNRIVFREDPSFGGYESDNHTVGIYKSIGGVPVTPVPEPGTYALMLAGLAVLGGLARRRTRR